MKTRKRKKRKNFKILMDVHLQYFFSFDMGIFFNEDYLGEKFKRKKEKKKGGNFY